MYYINVMHGRNPHFMITFEITVIICETHLMYPNREMITEVLRKYRKQMPQKGKMWMSLSETIRLFRGDVHTVNLYLEENWREPDDGILEVMDNVWCSVRV